MAIGRTLGYRAFADVSEDALLRIEAVHRLIGEVASALASLQIALAAQSRMGQTRAIGRAKLRLEAFGHCVALLADPAPGACAIGQQLKKLVCAIWAGQHFECPACYDLELEDIQVESALGQRILLISAELIGNALRHGLHQGGSTLRILLQKDEISVSLVVIDDGPGFCKARPFGAGQGIRIAGELAYRCGGTLRCTTDDKGACVSVQVPVASAPQGCSTRLRIT